jgi:hypothetical protein
MSQFFPSIGDKHKEFIEKQHLFFVASAPDSGRVNLSPKGLDCFKIIGPNQVAYLDMTGSGNETSAHMRQNGRITVMFCAFEDSPLILRLYGKGRAVTAVSSDWEEYIALFEPPVGTRQVMVIEVEQVQTACGFGVPLYDYQGDRETLPDYWKHQGEEGTKQYQDQNNARSIDGLEPYPLRGSKLSGQFKMR